MKKYKRKFLVPGDTPKGKDWHQRSAMCDELCGPVFKGSVGNVNKSRLTLPCTRNGRAWMERDYSKCIHPKEMFNEYLVSETEDGEWQCSCGAWKFKRRQCHHIEKAKANPEKYEIAVEFTETLKDVFGKVFKT